MMKFKMETGNDAFQFLRWRLTNLTIFSLRWTVIIMIFNLKIHAD